MKQLLILLCLMMSLSMQAQTTGAKRVYDEQINPLEQIDQALIKAKSEQKYVIAQVGGNWCPWCLRFAEFITSNDTIARTVNDNYVYIHVNVPRRGSANANVAQQQQLKQRIKGAGRFGYPVFVVFDAEGNVLHIQDSSFLEEGHGYNTEKTLRFFNAWTPKAVAESVK